MAGAEADNFVFAEDGKQMAFMAKSKDGQKSVWHYDPSVGKAAMLVNNQSSVIKKGLHVEQIIDYNSDGTQLFLV